eukprot:scaffold137346_cov148-Phaeocystis_antarctica.AAC.2
MAHIEADRKPLELDTLHLKKYAMSARIMNDDKDIKKAYDALDNLNLSYGSKDDIKDCMHELGGLFSSVSG